jgi:hypothetical protein
MVDFGASGLASCATTLRLDDGHVEAGRLVEREEVVAMLFRNPRPERKGSDGFSSCSRRNSVAAKRYRKTTPEEWARCRENQARLERVIERALAELGTTREEIGRRVGLSQPRRNSP